MINKKIKNELEKEAVESIELYGVDISPLKYKTFLRAWEELGEDKNYKDFLEHISNGLNWNKKFVSDKVALLFDTLQPCGMDELNFLEKIIIKIFHRKEVKIAKNVLRTREYVQFRLSKD